MPLRQTTSITSGTLQPKKLESFSSTYDGTRLDIFGAGMYTNEFAGRIGRPSSGLYFITINSQEVEIFRGGLIGGESTTIQAEKHPFEHAVFTNQR